MQENGHNFKDEGKCTKCGMTVEQYENNNKPKCLGTPRQVKAFRSDDQERPETNKPTPRRR